MRKLRRKMKVMKPLQSNQRTNLRSHAQPERVSDLYRHIDKIGDEYARALKRQVVKMRRILIGAYRTKIAPIIRRYEAEKSKVEKLATNSADEELEKILERYSGLIAVEIAAVLYAMEALFEPQAIGDIVSRFTSAVSEAQRRILLAEMMEEIGYINRDARDNMDYGVDEIVSEYLGNNLEFLSQTIPAEYAERANRSILDGMCKGLGVMAIGAGLQLYAEMSERRAEFIAHDQTNDLYLDLCERRQKNMDCESFEWVQRPHLSKVPRPEHTKRNGNVYRWDTGADDGLDEWRYPGEGYGCNCIPRPVFN